MERVEGDNHLTCEGEEAKVSRKRKVLWRRGDAKGSETREGGGSGEGDRIEGEGTNPGEGSERKGGETVGVGKRSSTGGPSHEPHACETRRHRQGRGGACAGERRCRAESGMVGKTVTASSRRWEGVGGAEQTASAHISFHAIAGVR